MLVRSSSWCGVDNAPRGHREIVDDGVELYRLREDALVLSRGLRQIVRDSHVLPYLEEDAEFNP